MAYVYENLFAGIISDLDVYIEKNQGVFEYTAQREPELSVWDPASLYHAYVGSKVYDYKLIADKVALAKNLSSKLKEIYNGMPCSEDRISFVDQTEKTEEESSSGVGSGAGVGFTSEIDEDTIATKSSGKSKSSKNKSQKTATETTSKDSAKRLSLTSKTLISNMTGEDIAQAINPALTSAADTLRNALSTEESILVEHSSKNGELDRLLQSFYELIDWSLDEINIVLLGIEASFMVKAKDSANKDLDAFDCTSRIQNAVSYFVQQSVSMATPTTRNGKVDEKLGRELRHIFKERVINIRGAYDRCESSSSRETKEQDKLGSLIDALKSAVTDLSRKGSSSYVAVVNQWCTDNITAFFSDNNRLNIDAGVERVASKHRAA